MGAGGGRGEPGPLCPARVVTRGGMGVVRTPGSARAEAGGQERCWRGLGERTGPGNGSRERWRCTGPGPGGGAAGTGGAGAPRLRGRGSGAPGAPCGAGGTELAGWRAAPRPSPCES